MRRDSTELRPASRSACEDGVSLVTDLSRVGHLRYHPGRRCQGTGATAAEARPRHVDKRVRADDCNSSPAVDVEATVAVIAGATNSGPSCPAPTMSTYIDCAPTADSASWRTRLCSWLTIASRSPCRIRCGGAPAWTR